MRVPQTQSACSKNEPTFQLLLFAAVLCLTHLLHPVDDLAVVERFLNGDVRHSARWHCAVPMFFVGGNQDTSPRRVFFVRPPFPFPQSKPGWTVNGLPE